MVRSGSRPGQVVPSGKHTGPGKLGNGKKGIHLRKVARLNADSGCPTHSDSENQSEAPQGLDRCAALLRDILRKEDSEIAYSENRNNPRLFEGKRYGSKRKVHEKCTVPLVRKENLSLDNKKQILKEASSDRDSSDVAQNQSLQDHYRMYSPIIYQALCEHVQTQMSLMSDLPTRTSGSSSLPCHTVSETQATPRSCSGLSTAVPVWFPQQPPCPQMVHTEVQTDDDNCFSSQTKTLSVNSTDILRNSFNSSFGVPCGFPKMDKPAPPAFTNGTLPQQEVPREPDLLKCLQTYINLLRSHGKESQPDNQVPGSPTLSQPTFLAVDEEKSAREKVGEITSEGKDLNTHMQDSRMKDLQKAKNVYQCAEEIRTVKYLLGELKALGVEHGDTEIQRLITELEACISLLPAMHENKSTQVEIAMAVQPLRSENAQLRRQLRILSQQLKKQEETQKASGSLDSNLELFSLQSLNSSLQNQLEESLKSQELLQNKNEELLKVIENQKDENRKIAGLFKKKDHILLENKQQFDIEMTRMKIELEEALVNLKSSQFKLEAMEKENQILGITLRQRDAEVTRLRELTRTLQSSMAKLLADLSTDHTRCMPGNNLTKSLLNIYDKQLQHDPVPTHTSVLSYLTQLETDRTLTPPEPLSPVPAGEALGPRPPFASARASTPSSAGSTEGLSQLGLASLPCPEKPEDVAAVLGAQCAVDSTVYMPFARSTPKRSLPAHVSPQPRACPGSSGRERGKGVDAAGAAGQQSRPRLEDKKLLKTIREVLGQVPGAPEQSGWPADASIFASDMQSDWSISSFSTFTSRDEQDFRTGLAALDANIARLQKSLQVGVLERQTQQDPAHPAL
ncbi:coiled-coil domain-containing protein 14 [Sorex araneus]|uniref:coiled-coil domain-containing protein 14 n=1 Tax=Sorex araneus TaxID=42254 RepID=UPI00243369C8|nr:coiled-coil domain-containing protein 14 [Sorex araneus]